MLIKSSTEDLQQYLIDEANNKGNCERVYIVEGIDDIIEVLKNANALNKTVTVCGNHTSLTGSSIPLSGWVIATERLNRIIEIDVENQCAIIEPAVTLQELQESLKSYNLFFPPDPTETSCFIGGMIGTNASGARSFKYGATRNFIAEIEIVLADGSVLNLKRNSLIQGNHFELIIQNDKAISFKIPSTYNLPDVKNTVGYYLKNNMDVIDLFIGAEGTLGIITLIKIKALPMPVNNISLVLFFDNVDDGFKFLSKIRYLSKNNFIQKNNDQIEARLIEFFDQKSLALLADHIPGIPVGSKAAFWIEQECWTNENYTNLLSAWEDFLTESNVKLENIWFGADERDRSKILNMRHILPILVNDLVTKRGMKKMGTDIALPDDKFEEYYKWAISIVEEKGIDYVAFGHFGDSHLHLNMLPDNSEQMIISQNIYTYLCSEAIRLGGTFSAEHGVGKLKKEYLLMMYDNANVDFMRNVKLSFDPNKLVGAGNLF